MHYFSKVKTGEELFSMVYGKGIVNFVLPKKFRIDGFHVFSVEYKKKKKKVHYTIDGFPNWASSNGTYQTVFYKEDIDFGDMKKQKADEVLSKSKILKLKEENKLEIQCPSGIWIDANECPEKLTTKALKKSDYYLFRKGKK